MVVEEGRIAARISAFVNVCFERSIQREKRCEMVDEGHGGN